MLSAFAVIAGARDPHRAWLSAAAKGRPAGRGRIQARARIAGLHDGQHPAIGGRRRHAADAFGAAARRVHRQPSKTKATINPH